MLYFLRKPPKAKDDRPDEPVQRYCRTIRKTTSPPDFDEFSRVVADLPEVMAMVSRENFEQAANSVAVLNRDQLKFRIKHFNGRFRLDFSEDYLNNLSVDRLRHILLAALLTASSH
jgi:hypothetical protein